MEHNIQIRTAICSDIHLLCHLSTVTFIETYGEENTPENLQAHLAEKFNHAQLLSEFNTEGTTFLIAFQDQEAVGYAKMQINIKEQTDQNALEIERIYLKNEYHGKGLGATLISKCIEIASLQQFSIIWLGVWEYNAKAITFYKKQGFEIFGSHIFQLGDEAQTDLLMKKRLANSTIL
jgi:ribosomal protein S18 acetylase RimI-like enzyme